MESIFTILWALILLFTFVALIAGIIFCSSIHDHEPSSLNGFGGGRLPVNK